MGETYHDAVGAVGSVGRDNLGVAIDEDVARRVNDRHELLARDGAQAAELDDLVGVQAAVAEVVLDDGGQLGGVRKEVGELACRELLEGGVAGRKDAAESSGERGQGRVRQGGAVRTVGASMSKKQKAHAPHITTTIIIIHTHRAPPPHCPQTRPGRAALTCTGRWGRRAPP